MHPYGKVGIFFVLQVSILFTNLLFIILFSLQFEIIDVKRFHPRKFIASAIISFRMRHGFIALCER